MSAYDEQIGRNLKRLRQEATDSDEADLALRMRLRGWDWDESVVRDVESGGRPLLRAEAEDVTNAIGFTEAFITMRTDAESVAELADFHGSQADRELRQAAVWWWEVDARYRRADSPTPISIESVVADGRRVFAAPQTTIGEPADDDRSMLLSTWEDLPERPRHPLDQGEVGVPWPPDRVLLQLDHDLREVSDALRYATFRWLCADRARTEHWPDDPRVSIEEIVEAARADVSD
ncbi:hypothetical protein KK101_05765 [Curtobacterium flaccumfaciens pv. oortii]|uniref:hypothetical protein n=1 Tax=Curtobacterium flaccumfaciens TaxID=2035 RepID=UPI001BDDF826|nr:hypothetical protein [Curtobacterium flaccumfaciens]MBT1622192.1 hypothetical protein [Curtobacterium flaccumfaciens pv. oortii]